MLKLTAQNGNWAFTFQDSTVEVLRVTQDVFPYTTYRHLQHSMILMKCELRLSREMNVSTLQHFKTTKTDKSVPPQMIRGYNR